MIHKDSSVPIQMTEQRDSWQRRATDLANKRGSVDAEEYERVVGELNKEREATQVLRAEHESVKEELKKKQGVSVALR